MVYIYLSNRLNIVKYMSSMTPLLFAFWRDLFSLVTVILVSFSTGEISCAILQISYYFFEFFMAKLCYKTYSYNGAACN